MHAGATWGTKDPAGSAGLDLAQGVTCGREHEALLALQGFAGACIHAAARLQLGSCAVARVGPFVVLADTACPASREQYHNQVQTLVRPVLV